MTIYILQSIYKGVPEYPKVFDTRKAAEKAKDKIEKSSLSEDYYMEIYEVVLSLKMKSFELV